MAMPDNDTYQIEPKRRIIENHPNSSNRAEQFIWLHH